MNPFGAPDWDHKPFAQGNQPVAQQCYELPGKFVSTSLAPSGARDGLRHRRGRVGRRDPRGLRARRRRRAGAPGRDLARLGPGRRPAADRAGRPPTTPAATAKLRLSRRGGLTATLTTGAAGRATFTAVLKRRTIAKRTVKVNGRATVRFKLKRRGAGHRQGDVHADGRPPQTREREAATALTISAPTTDPLRLSVRSPSVSV